MAFDFSFPVHEGTDSVGVPEGKKAVSGDDRHTSVAASYAIVDRSNRTEHRFDVHVRVPLNVEGRASLAEFNRQSVQQQLGVACGVDVSHAFVAQIATEFLSVGQVPVVGQGDAVGGIDVERLSLCSRR